MTRTLRRLASRIRDEIQNLDRAVHRASEAWQRAAVSSDGFYIDGVALDLHGFYAGEEQLFQLIATELDGISPAGEAWRQLLLQQMATDILQVRLPVLSATSRDGLDKYQAFRHIVRNVYAFRFDPVRIEQLVDGTSPIYAQVRARLLGVADFLDAWA
jgi:hypothetical protein